MLNPTPLDFFVLPAYPQLATNHWEVPMSDPYCLEFIEAMGNILVHLQQRENPHAQEPDHGQGQ